MYVRPMGGDTDDTGRIGRREALRTIGGAVAATGVARATRAQETTQEGGTTQGGGTTGGGIDYGGWFDGVGNFDGTEDASGRSSVTVRVGTQANGGPYGFGPPAIRVDPGTTVVWEWTGEGTHNVVEENEGYRSQLTSEQGFTFEQTFDSTGISKYYCEPHLSLGMKGAVVVGSPPFGSAGGSGGQGGGGTGPFGLPVDSTALSLGAVFLMAILSPLFFLLVLLRNREQLT